MALWNLYVVVTDPENNLDDEPLDIIGFSVAEETDPDGNIISGTLCLKAKKMDGSIFHVPLTEGGGYRFLLEKCPCTNH